MRNSKKKVANFLIGVTLVCVIVGLTSREAQQSIDIIRDEIQTNKHWINYKLGRPLKGTPELYKRAERLTEKNLKIGAPIFMRVFKLEAELELWMQGENGLKLFAVYPICRWSGGLGPKIKEGDHQSPEGFYTVAKRQLNANSRWYKSFNIGYPNLFDRQFKRTGSYLMVHGGCSSVGCYAMTNDVMKEIWDIVRAALNGGQKRFAIHIFPFRMTNRNMYVYADKKWFEYWKNLKQGYDLFETSKVPPEVSVCKSKYKFVAGKSSKSGNAPLLKSSCPEISTNEKKSDPGKKKTN